MSSGMNKIGQGSWEQERLGVRRNFQRIASTVLGPNSTPPFAGIYLTGLTANALIYPDSNKFLTSATYLTTSGTTLDIAGKVTVGSQASPQDVTVTRQYGFELHYSGNNYNVTGIRSRAQLVTTDASTKTALGGLFQAANNDGIDAGVLMGFMAEAIGKSISNASTITTMRGGLIGTEWGALDTVTNLKTLHIRGHSRNAAGAGSFGTGYALYIENEAVGGNGQAYDAGIYFKGTNLSAGNKAFTYGIDFSGGSYGTAEIKLSSGGNIDMNAGRLWSSSGNILIQPSSTYKIIIQPTTDSTTFFGVYDADGGTPILNVDTTNERIGIGTAEPKAKLHVINVIRLTGSQRIIEMERSAGSGVFHKIICGPHLVFQTAGTRDIVFSLNGVDKHTWNSDGKVGIGERNPETALEIKNVEPYLTIHNETHEDMDGGGESRLIYKREDGAGTETACFQFEASHDGSGANDQLGKGVWSVNTGAGLVQVLEIDSAGTTKTFFSRQKKTTRITGNTTLGTTHHEVFCDTDGGVFTVTLPAGVVGRNYRIINTGNSGNDVTLTPDGSELLIGSNSSKTISDGTVIVITFESTEGWW